MSIRSATIEGYLGDSQCGSIFELADGKTSKMSQSDICSQMIKADYEEPVKGIKREYLPQMDLGCKKEDDAGSLASYAKTDSDYYEDELRKDVKDDDGVLVLMEDILVVGPVPLMFFLPECRMKQTY
jgi:hypothetical protein